MSQQGSSDVTDPRPPRTSGLDAVFHPESVAVIGASSHPKKIGGRPVHHLRSLGFRGKIYPVNPNYDEVQGLAAYRSIDAIEDAVDLAIVAVPGSSALDEVRACARKGVKAVVLFSAGFAESGPAGELQQRELTRIAESTGMRIIGPNCIGAADMRTGCIATFAATVMLPRPRAGNDAPRVALVSQSGAVGGHCVTLAAQRGFEFDPWITTGNESDVDVADCIAYFAQADGVSAICVYMEGCTDGRRLESALALARANRKPVIMLKAGTSEAGAAAAASHTASLVGSDAAYNALFDRHAACRVRSIRELVDTAYALAFSGLPRGRRVGILTGSGGAGILMADAAAESGLEVPGLPEDVRHSLKQIWPPSGVGNPIDTTAQVTNDPELLSAFLDTVLQGTDFDSILVFLTYLGLMEPWSSNILQSLGKVRSEHPDANILVSILATDEVRDRLHDLRMPVFDDLHDLVRVAGLLAAVRAGLDATPAEAPVSTSETPVLQPGDGATEDEAKRWLQRAGVPVAPEVVVTSPAEARDVADRMGYPVVLKIVSPDIIHKSEVGGVAIGLPDGDAVEAAYAKILASVGGRLPGADIRGVLVARMVTGGVETMLGAKNDPSLGMTVVFGLGGIFVEVLRDVSVRLAPVSVDEAHAMIAQIKGHAVLEGARGAEPSDVEVLAQAISALSVFAAANDHTIESIDVNPFIVLPKGQGAFAVDAVMSHKSPAL